MRVFALSILCCIPMFSIGQQSELINPAGEESTTSNYQVSYSIGEVVVQTSQSTEEPIVTQGYHQSRLTVTGIMEAPEELALSVFPNPTSGEIFIHSKDMNQFIGFQLFDFSGSQVMQIENSSNDRLTLDLSELSNGTYLLKAIHISENTHYTYQIIKSN